MKNIIRSKPICGKPVHSFFTGPDKYLRLQHHLISDITPPISENESLFLFVNEGSGAITINGVEFPMEYGTFAWLQSYHTFTIRADAGSALDLTVCVYDYPLSSFLTFQEPDPDTVDAVIDTLPIVSVEGRRLENLRRLFDEFEKENDCFDPGSSLIKVSILGEITSLFIKHNVRQQSAQADIPRPLGWKAILYLSAHFSEDLTAESVAAYFDSDAATLNRELRNISGYNFSSNLNRIRVNIASIALLYEDMSLSYVALHAGFPSEVAFYRIFKKHMGTSPMEYRKQILNTSGKGVYRGMIMGTTLMRVLNHSYSSFSAPMDIKDTSRKLYISESVIRDLITEKFGSNYKDMTVLTRIRHAEALLLTTDLPILDIAINVGFNCSRSFTRTFNRLHSMTPSEYRAKFRGGPNHE